MQNTLCNKHNEIISRIYHLKQECKEYNIPLDLLNKFTECVKLCRQCKKDGQRMENRLKKYRTYIENLGFKRINGREMV